MNGTATIGAAAPPLDAFEVFPFRARPQASWHDSPRRFGARRANGRLHAGCDLYVPHGTEILAAADGVITRFAFFALNSTLTQKVSAMEILHAGGWIGRYCEIANTLPAGLKAGSAVKAGQVIAFVGPLMDVLDVPSDMLHFEMYAGTASGSLSDFGRPPFMRRKDLIDPTPYLDAAAARLGTT
ncbi:M23 family metallopeptidase [Elioraea sp. Yellowstone]|jgi:murein DD-endopeptidase MepM/ murein hydrolase activator NlpD|uniref:M23 family metallopeptidase n=1 Tax=Elioraea sp. Yellowstone TaxID=2592070 RepID=UPI001386C159|nr:M23 family metallopeptidase [Elioraea sp. Yellowstone]